MQNTTKRSRARIAAVGALVGTIMSIGAVAGDVSAQGSTAPSDSPAVTKVDTGWNADGSSGGIWGGIARMMSGIRW